MKVGEVAIHRGDYAHTNAAHENDDTVLVHINYVGKDNMFEFGGMYSVEVWLQRTKRG